jgi:TP901 family phage tail tape measure protein
VANTFTSSITLQFNDLFSTGFLQARNNLLGMQATLNGINSAGLGGIQTDIAALGNSLAGLNTSGLERVNAGLAGLSSSAITIPVPDIPQPTIPAPDTPRIGIPTPDIGKPVIPTPDIPPVTIPVPDIPQPTIPTPDTPPMNIPAPNIPQPTIPAPDTSLFRQGLNEIQAGLDKIVENNALNTLATQLSTMSMAMSPIQQSLRSMMDQPSKLAGSFESSLKNIQAITGNTDKEMAVLNQRLLDIGKNAVAGPQGVVNAMNDIAGGVDNAESHMGILNGAILLAEAGQADLGVAANGLVSIMNAYSLASGDAASATANAVAVSDALTQTVGQGVGSMEAFIGAFSQVSGLSASVGVGFDEVGAALAFITTQGPSASEAATQLKAAETALLNPNKTLSDALQSIGIASGSAMLAEYGLVESLHIVRQSVGGSQDAMAKALGSTEALNGATALLGSGYTDFAAKFGNAIKSSVTAEAAAIQNQSYESKLARMEAATEVLQLQIGDNINAIKGRFVELGAGFLVNVVSPIMSSPIGGVFQEVAAVAGVAGQGLLSFGGTALSTAAQFTTLAANIKNAGGYAKIFHGVMTVTQAPLKPIMTGLSGIGRGIIGIGGSIAGTLPKIGAWISSMWTAEAAHRAGAAIRSFPANILGVGKSIVQTIPKIGAWIVSMGKAATVNAMASGKSLWSGIASGIAGVGGSFISALPAVGAWIASGWATAVAWIAATWPILAVVAAIALVAGGVYLLIKNWDSVAGFFTGLWNKITSIFSIAFDWIRNKLAGVSDWVLGAVAVFLPFIGIPALIIKHWDTIAAFFVGLWTRITGWVISAWEGIKTFFASLWNTIVSTFTAVWNAIPGFFASLWNGIISIVATVGNWLTGVWQTVAGVFAAAWTWVSNLFTSIWEGMTGAVATAAGWFGETFGFIANAFAAAWTWVSNLFTSIWEGIKGVVMGFVEWLSPIIDLIIAPFRSIGNVIGGIIGSVKGWFGETVEIGKTELARMGENNMGDTAASPVQNMPAPTAQATIPNASAAVAPTPDLGQPLITPVFADGAATVQPITVTDVGGALASSPPESLTTVGQSPALTGQLPSALSPAKMNSPVVSYQASSAFESAMSGNNTLMPSMDMSASLNAATITPAIPSVDMDDFNKQALITFQAAMPAPERPATLENTRQTPERTAPVSQSIKIENLYLQAEECQTLFDFVKILMQSVHKPEAEAV